MFSKLRAFSAKVFPGLAIAVTIGFAASFLGEHYGAPTMLFALLLGMALGFIYEDERTVVGVDFAGCEVLRLGVALLGLRIAIGDVIAVGWSTLALMAVGIVSTILVGMGLSRLLGFRSRFGALTGGAVAICGASAAMALSAVLPNDKFKEQNTIFAVIGVTSLSTLAMIVYPIISGSLEHSDMAAGLFLGGTIHDVAQVVGAGYSISESAGDQATLVKLIRVAFLVPVVFMFAIAFRGNSAEAKGGQVLPWFLIAFAVFVVINSYFPLPDVLQSTLVEASRFMLVTAIAAIGLKSNLKQLVNVGVRPVILMVLETLWLAAVILVGMEVVL